ncbi:hypothetical protein PHLCEN_2v4188 [Hermanssonia centrifuga]|uniref:Uncharacterized protein n=1 Tax=Hermanssonia centrifuga TaxID=98765 RepID=A0A2R6PZ02_9APHY|nr:hypothetical protein PHLCEN_2v4188 [Hermanssonia centrifuga]
MAGQYEKGGSTCAVDDDGLGGANTNIKGLDKAVEGIVESTETPEVLKDQRLPTEPTLRTTTCADLNSGQRSKTPPPQATVMAPSSPAPSTASSMPSTPQSLLSSSDGLSVLQMPPSTPGSTVSYWKEKMLAYRTKLINNSVYLGDAAVDVKNQLCWIRLKKKSILCTVEALATYDAERAAYNEDITNVDPPSAPEPVTLSAVWCIDEEYFFMTADGNWNPKKDFGGFETSKATCLMAQANEAVFAADYVDTSPVLYQQNQHTNTRERCSYACTVISQ